jgi:hypothetical protein
MNMCWLRLAAWKCDIDVDGPERALAQVPVVLPCPCRDPRVQLSAPRVFPSAESLSEFNATDKDPTHRALTARCLGRCQRASRGHGPSCAVTAEQSQPFFSRAQSHQQEAIAVSRMV